MLLSASLRGIVGCLSLRTERYCAKSHEVSCTKIHEVQNDVPHRNLLAVGGWSCVWIIGGLRNLENGRCP